MTDVAERRTSGGQEMLIVSSVADYTDQEGRPLVTNEETIIYVALKEER